MALLALMRRARMRVSAEACEAAARTYDLAAADASPASSVARVIVLDGCGRVQPARSEPARILYLLSPPASQRSYLLLRISQARIHRRRGHRRDREPPLCLPGCGPEAVLGSTLRPR